MKMMFMKIINTAVINADMFGGKKNQIINGEEKGITMSIKEIRKSITEIQESNRAQHVRIKKALSMICDELEKLHKEDFKDIITQPTTSKEELFKKLKEIKEKKSGHLE